MIKRLCLFAGYDSQNIIDDYVIYLIQELSVLSDVHYICDCEMPQSELNKLNNITSSVAAFRHNKRDFGSWQELILKIGWENIDRYDELILINDSCFGPIFPLLPIFNKMSGSTNDFWGLTKNHTHKPHLQSYFLVFKKQVF